MEIEGVGLKWDPLEFFSLLQLRQPLQENTVHRLKNLQRHESSAQGTWKSLVFFILSTAELTNSNSVFNF